MELFDGYKKIIIQIILLEGVILMNIKEMQEKVNKIKDLLDPKVIEREKQAQRRRGLAKGIAIGGIVAGVSALFLSPDSGENNRKKAMEELEKAKELLEINLLDGKDKFAQIYEEKKEMLGEKKNILMDKFNLNDDIHNIKEDISEDLEDLDDLTEEEY